MWSILPCPLNARLYATIWVQMKQKLDRRELSPTGYGYQCLDFCCPSQHLVWEKWAGENYLWWLIMKADWGSLCYLSCWNAVLCHWCCYGHEGSVPVFGKPWWFICAGGMAESCAGLRSGVLTRSCCLQQEQARPKNRQQCQGVCALLAFNSNGCSLFSKSLVCLFSLLFLVACKMLTANN